MGELLFIFTKEIKINYVFFDEEAINFLMRMNK